MEETQAGFPFSLAVLNLVTRELHPLFEVGDTPCHPQDVPKASWDVAGLCSVSPMGMSRYRCFKRIHLQTEKKFPVKNIKISELLASSPVQPLFRRKLISTLQLKCFFFAL